MCHGCVSRDGDSRTADTAVAPPVSSAGLTSVMASGGSSSTTSVLTPPTGAAHGEEEDVEVEIDRKAIESRESQDHREEGRQGREACEVRQPETRPGAGGSLGPGQQR